MEHAGAPGAIRHVAATFHGFDHIADAQRIGRHGQAQPAKPGAAKVVATKPAAGKPAAVAAPPAAAAQPAPPVLIAPPPQPAPAPVTHDAAPPKTDPNAPVTTGSQP